MSLLFLRSAGLRVRVSRLADHFAILKLMFREHFRDGDQLLECVVRLAHRLQLRQIRDADVVQRGQFATCVTDRSDWVKRKAYKRSARSALPASELDSVEELLCSCMHPGGGFGSVTEDS